MGPKKKMKGNHQQPKSIEQYQIRFGLEAFALAREWIFKPSQDALAAKQNKSIEEKPSKPVNCISSWMNCIPILGSIEAIVLVNLLNQKQKLLLRKRFARDTNPILVWYRRTMDSILASKTRL